MFFWKWRLFFCLHLIFLISLDTFCRCVWVCVCVRKYAWVDVCVWGGGGVTCVRVYVGRCACMQLAQVWALIILMWGVLFCVRGRVRMYMKNENADLSVSLHGCRQYTTACGLSWVWNCFEHGLCYLMCKSVMLTRPYKPCPCNSCIKTALCSDQVSEIVKSAAGLQW